MDRPKSPALGSLMTNSESMASLVSEKSHRLSTHVADSDSWSISSNNDLQIVQIAEVKDMPSGEDQDSSSVMFFQTGSDQPPNRTAAPAPARIPTSHGQNGSFHRPGDVVTTSSGDSVTTASKERTVEDEELSRGVSQVSFSATMNSQDSGLSTSTPSSFGTAAGGGELFGSYLSSSTDNLMDEMEPYLMSSVVTLMVRIPAYIAPGQKGRGKILKCTFSPHSSVYQVRFTITETIQNETPISLSHLRLCRQLPDGSWQWLDEQRCLGVHGILTEAQLEMKEIEAHFRDVIINIPQLGNQVNLEYDQFSLVQDILDAVLRIHDEQLNASSHSYALYHVRHKTRLSLTESMVFYEILSTDKLELKMVQGRAKMVVLTVDIPEAKSQRKIRASLDQTVGDLMSTLIRRLTDISERAWQYFSLYLKPRTGRRSKGMWMEEYKFLSTYNLDEQDVLEYRPKYRLFSFQLRVFPPCPSVPMYNSDEDALLSAASSGGLPGTSNKPAFDPNYPRLLVDETTTNKQVVELLSNACGFEYPASWYGLFDQNGAELPRDKQIWDLVPRTGVEQQDTNFCIHMRYHSIKVSQDAEPDSEMQLSVDLSWPVSHMRDLLSRRCGIRDPHSCGVLFRGSFLQPNISLLKQDVTEGAHVTLKYLSAEDPWENSPSIGPSIDDPYDDEPGSSVDTTFDSSYLQHVLQTSGRPKPQQPSNRQVYVKPSDDRPFWDEPPDSDDNIRFQKENGRDVVTAGTFNKLVERLTHSDMSDLDFAHTFMATYQNFTKPEKLFSKLLERYSAVRSDSMTFKEFSAFRTNIQVRTINAIRMWLDTAGDDFVNNDSLLQRILDYTDDVVMVDWGKFAGGMRTRINELRKGQTKKNRKATSLDPPPRPILPSNVGTKVSLFAFEPEEIARQMSLIDFKIYSTILPHEFLNQCWAKPKYKDRAVNLLRMIDRMNTVTFWVATTILSQKDKYGRAKRITSFLQIAEQLHKMKNYLTMMSVLSGLQHSSIMRLKKTYDKVDKKHMKVLTELCELIIPGKNFRQLRELQDNAVPPSMPYIGIFMADLTFIDTGNDNLLPGGLINFSKCRLIYSQIRQILAAQNTPYNFEAIPSLEESLTKMHVLNPDILGEMSLQREPR
ncbi:uncharacterized protein LOC135809364 [Sycon ciliatum]|uniref:uncharacterized protein LOC135809364 n=1 Tax=Sycon ciliatum TaxID=27933 RepID=UPI0020AB993B|eukprot:scpid19331/ scgid31017/ Ras guanine nucleotide exchange factor A; RasGEF domain-containing protein A